jgi:Uma2 family endonuclease
MTVDEFLHWEDGTDTRYELVGGLVYAMAPPAPWHSRLAGRLGSAIGAALRSRPECAVHPEAGLAPPDQNDTCYIADIAVTCEPLRRENQLIREPILIIEILSPSTAGSDRRMKVADYRKIPSVQEILLIDSRTVFAELLRHEAGRWITEIVQGPGATLTLTSVLLTIGMFELYEGIPIEERVFRPGSTS